MVALVLLGLAAFAIFRTFDSFTSGHIDTANQFIDDVRETGTSDTMCAPMDQTQLDVLATSTSQDLNSVNVVNSQGVSEGALLFERERWSIEVGTRNTTSGHCVEYWQATPPGVSSDDG